MDEVSLSNGEKIILKGQGTLMFKSTWQLGHLFLTDRRLIFIQAAKTILEYRLDKIIEMSIMKRSWLMGIKVKQLCIEFNCGSGREQACIALVKPDEWVAAIKEEMTLMLFHSRQG
jgi:hypothetical protein